MNAEWFESSVEFTGLRDSGALQSVVGRLETGYYADAIEQAAALFESPSQNHLFLDGNKRTAIPATGVFRFHCRRTPQLTSEGLARKSTPM
ncbi:MAG: Fic family protein [Candidatus Acidiferrum sp.]|jgi:prophage maintenance system killer protein